MKEVEPSGEFSPQNWGTFLTSELRAHFERAGENLVATDVSRHAYKDPKKHYAALFWLKEQRERRQGRESRRFWITAVLAFVAAVASVLGLFLS